MNKRVLVIIGGLLLLTLASPALAAWVASPQMSSSHYAMDWSLAGSASGGAGASAHYALSQATIDQMAAADGSASAHYNLCSGARCIDNGPFQSTIYLPAVTH